MIRYAVFVPLDAVLEPFITVCVPLEAVLEPFVTVCVPFCDCWGRAEVSVRAQGLPFSVTSTVWFMHMDVPPVCMCVCVYDTCMCVYVYMYVYVCHKHG